MGNASRLLAYRKLMASFQDKVMQRLRAIDMDIDFFAADSMIVVEIEGQDTVDAVVDALDRTWELSINSPSVTKRKAFALVGPQMTVRRVGSVLQIYKSR